MHHILEPRNGNLDGGKSKNNLLVKLLLQWFWLKSDLHKIWNDIVQVPFGLDPESDNVTTLHQGSSYKVFDLVRHIRKLVSEVFAWI